MGNTTMDKRGRILIPIEVRKRLRLKTGTKFELTQDNSTLILKPLIYEPMRIEAKNRKWKKEVFLKSGEATFSE